MIADGKIMKEIRMRQADLAQGIVDLEPVLDSSLYYKVVEELMGAPVENDSQMFLLLREYAQAKMAWDNIRGALEQAETDDYGIVAPRLSDMVLEKPEVFRQGNKYGVRMTAKAPVFTTATACSSAVTGVGATPALGSQAENGKTAVFIPNPKKAITYIKSARLR